MITTKLKLILSAFLMVFVLANCSSPNSNLEEEIEITETNPVDLQPLELISPADGADEQATTIELSWKFVENAQSYHILIAEDANFDSTTVVDELIESKSYEATLEAGNTYYWKIRLLQDGETGPWSQVWSFSTAMIAKDPISVELLAPADGVEVDADETMFSWNAAADGGKYHFQVAEDEAFTVIAQDSVTTQTELSVAGLDGEKQYYWRVNPVLENETGAWSQVRSFMTGVKVDTTPSEPTTPPAANSGFVDVQNADFTLDGQVYRVVGSNAYHLPNYEKIDPKVVDRAMDSFADAGVNVIRIWGFYDGQPQYNGDITLQPQAGVYNEEDLVRLDNVMAKSKEHGVKVVLALVNYWDQLGGINQYNEWAGQSGGMMAFINGEKQQEWFKEYISMLLNRVNTVTGVAYKDDPTVFAWEIMNEGRNRGNDPQIIRDWYQEIAQFIKSIDPNHMVSTGEEGFDEGTPAEYSKDQYSNTYILRAEEGTSYVMNTQIPEIDYGTAHWYPGDWGWHINSWDENSAAAQNLIKAQQAWMKDHAQIAEDAGKPFLMGEYGFAGWGDERVEAIYDDFWKTAESIELDGSLIWQLTPDYTKCSEFGGNICWPGGRGDEELYLGFKAHIDAMTK